MPVIKRWLTDESGMVVAFVALSLPVLLLIGVLVLQGGQLFIRQAQLQFVARQAANSSVVLVAQMLQQAAESNYENLCRGVDLPSVCASDQWQDFLSLTEVQNFTGTADFQQQVVTEAKTFAVQTDPQAALMSDQVVVDFPGLESLGNQLVVQVQIAQPRTFWVESLSPQAENVLQATARSYLSLSS